MALHHQSHYEDAKQRGRHKYQRIRKEEWSRREKMRSFDTNHEDDKDRIVKRAGVKKNEMKADQRSSCRTDAEMEERGGGDESSSWSRRWDGEELKDGSVEER